MHTSPFTQKKLVPKNSKCSIACPQLLHSAFFDPAEQTNSLEVERIVKTECAHTSMLSMLPMLTEL